MKKLLFWNILILLVAVSCSKDDSPNDPGQGTGESRIIFSMNTDRNVNNKVRSDGDYSYWIKLDGPEVKAFELTTTTVDALPGDYVITANTPISYTLPAFNLPVYIGTTNVTVPAKGYAPAKITLTQANVGIRFVFDESVRTYFTALTVKIEDNTDSEKTLNFGYADETAGKIAYFEPGTIKLSLSDGSVSVPIKGEESTTISTSKKEVWTITLTTSSIKAGGVDFEVEVDTDTDNIEGDFGVGEVLGEGTFASPYSVGDAINAMPVTDKWVEGYVINTTTVITRSAPNAVLIGAKADSDESECIVMKLPADALSPLSILADPSAVGEIIKIRGDVIGHSPDFTSNAKAVFANVVDFDSELRSVSVNGTNPITVSGNVLKSMGSGSSIFKMGATVKTDHLIKSGGAPMDYKDLLLRDFNSITLEYEMKMSQQVKFNSDPELAYRLEWLKGVKTFATANNIAVHGHTLVWQQDPIPTEWGSLDAAGLKQKLEEYMETTMAEYDYVRSWDVVNEAINNSDGNYWPCAWLDAYGGGEAYVKAAFQIARRIVNEKKAIDPTYDCKLFYNDYKTEIYPTKKDAIIQMITNINREHALANDGEVLIDGIGLQMHLIAGIPKAHLKAAIDAAVNTGLLIHISELSVSLFDGTDVDAEQKEVTPELLAKQTQTFNDIFDLAFQIPEDQLWGITFWGVNDSFSIYEYRQGMIFDAEFNAKRAYFDVISNWSK